MKVYTKTGDKGETSLYDGNRASKHAINFEVIGEIDELSSRIGMLCVYCPENKILRKIQRTLQDFNSHIATIEKKGKKLPELSPQLLTELETAIDTMENENTKLNKFILPGVTIADAQAHLCRTQTRKAERALNAINSTSEVLVVTKNGLRNNIELKKEFTIPIIMLQYINRLSDFFFVLARWICKKEKKQDFFL